MAWGQETNIKGPVGPPGVQGPPGADSTVPGPPGPPGTTDWNAITGKPPTFPPTVPIPWTDVSGKPSTFPPSAHGHPFTDITGTLTDAQHGNRAGGALHATATAASAGFFLDAASDGTQYVRRNAAWSPVSVPPGTVVSDTAPGSPQSGQLWFESDSGNLYIWYTDANSSQWVQVSAPPSPAAQLTAQTRNRVINGAMQISQENGNTAGATQTYFAVDQFMMQHNMTCTLTMQRVQSVTPNGSPNRLRATVTVADAALAAGDLAYIAQSIEGIRVADFSYGTATAKQSVLRFGFKGPAGTYSLRLTNTGETRSYIANFTIAAGQANTDTTQVFVIPGDVTGTWAKDTTQGIIFYVVLAAGTTFQGVAGWNAGQFHGTAANTNGMATAGAVYELFDVGLYLDPDTTGIPPKWAMPDEAQELAACMRYWQQTVHVWSGYAYNVATTCYTNSVLPVAPRGTPALAGVSTSASSFPATAGTLTMAFGQVVQESRTTTGAVNGPAFYQTRVTVNARM